MCIRDRLNADTDADSIPPVLCAETLPKVISEIVGLRQKCPTRRVLMSKADVSDAFQSVRIGPNEAHSFCYTVGEMGSHRLPPDVRVVVVAGLLGRDVGGG